MPSTTRSRDAHQPNQSQDRTGRGRPDDDQQDYSPSTEVELEPGTRGEVAQQRSRTRKARGRI